MASSFFVLFEDISIIMDDVATMSKLATKKTAGILGDDLAVNAEKASGFISEREIPVLWKITKGSFINKIIILPIAFLLSYFLPWSIIPILLIGGIYLAYEGAEKIYHYVFHRNHSSKKEEIMEMTDDEHIEYENKKVKSAILVDFILSIEIVIIALSTVVEKDLITQIIVVSIVAILATVGVYGIVALIVRMDDFGYKLISLNTKKKSISKIIGFGLVKSLPFVIKALAVIGTIAMILVAGGIYVHNIHYLHELFHNIPSIVSELIVGLIVGFITLIFVNVFLKIKQKIVKK